LPRSKLEKDDIRALYEQHSSSLLLYARSMLPDRAVAEDVLHEVFSVLLRGNTELPDVPAAYLFRAVRNAALNARRNEAKHVALDAEEPWFQHRRSSPESALALQSALRELPEEQREAVILRIWAGMTLEEVAAATGVPLNTAASRYRYALEKLRDRLKQWSPTEENIANER
jgi:RNA polymerase sigma-70 factor, ECF subfamily